MYSKNVFSSRETLVHYMYAIADSLMITRKWNQPKCPSVDKEIVTHTHTHTQTDIHTGYYSSLKNSTI